MDSLSGTSFMYCLHPPHKVPKAALITLCFVCAVTLSISAGQIAHAAAVSHGSIYATFPVARTVQVKPVEAPAKVVRQKKTDAHLQIPSIQVNAVIKDMGLTSDGAMAIPDVRADVGWYSSGTRPGETGSAVIGGHARWGRGAGVFDHLDQLIKGDVLSVVDVKGISTTFVVRETRTFDATDTNSGIFASESGIHLNLITCSGVWDPKTNSYTKRLVIFTDVAK